MTMPMMPILGARNTGVTVTWDPANKGANITLSNGNLDADGATAFNTVRSTLGKSAGKYYAELLVNTYSGGGNLIVGFVDGSASLTTYAGNSAKGRGGQLNGTSYVNGWTAGSAWAGAAATNVIGLAIDLSAGKGFIAVNNTWQGSSDPAAGTNAWVTAVTGTVYVATSPAGTGNRVTLRTKASQFTYSPPSGYSAWATP